MSEAKIDDPRLPDAFWKNVVPEPNSGCWLWVGRDFRGYGSAYITGFGDWRAHRLSYFTLVGPVERPLMLDHLCRNRCCVNPAHLEPVTNSENIRRSPLNNARQKSATHCPQGHEYAGRNLITWVMPWGTKRGCRACRNARSSAHAKLRRERARAGMGSK